MEKETENVSKYSRRQWVGCIIKNAFGDSSSALVGCATPVGVRKVSHEKACQTLTASVLSGGGLSEPTVQVLNRAGLEEAYSDSPADVIAELHQTISTKRDSDLLFALAELSFRQGERSGEGAYSLSAAVYAYAFLFPA